MKKHKFMSDLYVGKVFTLKNVHRIPWCSHNTKPKYGDKSHIQQGSLQEEDVGECVLIVDERSKKVRIITKDQSLVWIAKYYLAKEVYNDASNDGVFSKLDRCITELSKIGNHTTTKDGTQIKLFNIVQSLRNIKDSLEKE